MTGQPGDQIFFVEDMFAVDPSIYGLSLGDAAMVAAFPFQMLGRERLCEVLDVNALREEPSR